MSEDQPNIERRDPRERALDAIRSLSRSNIGTDPGGRSPDSLMSQAYAGLLIHDQSNNTLVDLIVEAGGMRHETEYPMRFIHGALIFVYGINQLMLFKHRYTNYPEHFDLSNPENWNQVYEMIANDIPATDVLFNTLLHKNLMTSNPRRGNDLNFIIKQVLGDEDVSWIDFGSSAGHPVLAALQGDQDPDLMNFQDDTIYDGRSNLLKAACVSPVRANKVVLVDHSNPYEDPEWFLSCCYPVDATAKKIEVTRARMKKYKSTNNFKFENRNMTDRPINPHKFDVATAIVSGYELDRQHQDVFTREIMPDHITDNGVMVVKDYVEIDPDGNLRFIDERTPYSCKTAVYSPRLGNRWYLVTEHSTSRGHTTRKAPDFDLFMEATEALKNVD